MCLHDNAIETGTETVTYWTGDDLFVCVEFQRVRCPDCDGTFALDDLHDLG